MLFFVRIEIEDKRTETGRLPVFCSWVLKARCRPALRHLTQSPCSTNSNWWKTELLLNYTWKFVRTSQTTHQSNTSILDFQVISRQSLLRLCCGFCTVWYGGFVLMFGGKEPPRPAEWQGLVRVNAETCGVQLLVQFEIATNNTVKVMFTAGKWHKDI